MTQYRPIDCSAYDYLEIACMDRYRVDLQLEDGEASGTADGLETRAGQEFLRITAHAGTELIRIDRIRRMTVLSRPSRFASHDFR
jgi:transcriptional antiterminator Rof (Rho-off)